MFKDLLAGIGQLVYPPSKNRIQSCRAFDFTQKFIIMDSYSLEANRPPFCVKCSRNLGDAPAFSACPTCRKFKPVFDFAWSALLYKEPLKQLIHNFKYGQKTYLRHPFGAVITQFVDTYRFDIAQFDAIVPVALHPARLRERGYNQSALLAGHVAKSYNINLYTNTLKRHRATKPQSALDRKQRWTNIRGAFKIMRSNELENKNILLVDDLLTTGATASECAAALKAAGAKTVGVLTLAIAPVG